jgi:transposase
MRLPDVGTHAAPPLARRRLALEASALCLFGTSTRGGAEKGGIRRRLGRKQPGDVLLFADWTLLRLFPPLRAAWSQVGTQAVVPVTGRNAKRVLFGAINVRTGHRIVLCRPQAGGADARAFLEELRRRYPKAPTIWLLLDRASAHTDTKTVCLALDLGIKLVWLPKQWPELNAMDHLWKELKRLLAANRQAAHMDQLAAEAAAWVLQLRPRDALRKAGILSPTFWLRGV